MERSGRDGPLVTRSFKRERKNGRFIPPIVLVCLLFLPPIGSAHIEPWYEVGITEVDHWEDPLGVGSDLMFDISYDGSRLALVSTEDPDEISIVDRELETLATLHPPGENATINGVQWSDGSRWVAAWGRAEDMDSDFFQVWDVPTYKPTDAPFANATSSLPIISATRFLADDMILAIAGRDANGTSRLLIVETSNMNVHRNVTWEANTTILFLRSDGINLYCVDELGTITSISGMDWMLKDTYIGLSARPTAFALNRVKRGYWLMGYENGSTFFWGGIPFRPMGVNEFGDGPVESLARIFPSLEDYFLVATPRDGGGSTIQALKYIANVTTLHPSNRIETEASVTMMQPDPLNPGNVVIGFSDGSLTFYNMTLVPDNPPMVSILELEDPSATTGIIVVRGTVTDDNDNIQWVRVKVDDGEWFDINWTGTDWTLEINATLLSDGQHSLAVVAYDGRFNSFPATRFFPVGEGYIPEGLSLDSLITYVLIILIGIAVIRKVWGKNRRATK